MDALQLIALVAEHEELYNVTHPEYSNQQRRDQIWKEIGRRMNQTSAGCKSKWSRIRDNHRKALNLRRSKSGQAGSQMKPPKFHKELQFLVPYMTDEEESITNLTYSYPDETIDMEDEYKEGESENFATTILQTLSAYSSPTPSHSSKHSSSSQRKSGKRTVIAENCTPQVQSSAATVLENYLKFKAMQADKSNQPTDPLMEFFVNMARTVKNFPLQDQIKIKGQLFQMVNSVEMRLAQEALSPGPSTYPDGT